jgi:transposase
LRGSPSRPARSAPRSPTTSTARRSARCSATPKTAVCPATILAEIGDCRDRYRTRSALSADGGQAPVAVDSGKSKRARFRWAGDDCLRDAFATMADTSRHPNPPGPPTSMTARARGGSHQHAIRILARAWCTVIWRLCHDHDVYDPARHTARQRLQNTTA